MFFRIELTLIDPSCQTFHLKVPVNFDLPEPFFSFYPSEIRVTSESWTNYSVTCPFSCVLKDVRTGPCGESVYGHTKVTLQRMEADFTRNITWFSRSPTLVSPLRAVTSSYPYLLDTGFCLSPFFLKSSSVHCISLRAGYLSVAVLVRCIRVKLR